VQELTGDEFIINRRR